MVFWTVHDNSRASEHCRSGKPRTRVQTAIKNAGLHFPRHRIVVNLVPSSTVVLLSSLG
jgi:hypothetical protein